MSVNAQQTAGVATCRLESLGARAIHPSAKVVITPHSATFKEGQQVDVRVLCPVRRSQGLHSGSATPVCDDLPEFVLITQPTQLSRFRALIFLMQMESMIGCTQSRYKLETFVDGLQPMLFVSI